MQPQNRRRLIAAALPPLLVTVAAVTWLAARDRTQDPHVPFSVLPSSMPGSEGDTRERIVLGRTLYFDPILSLDSSQSCNDCHRLDGSLAGTDYRRTSLGVKGEAGTRNAPTVLNAGYQVSQFWDGRAEDLIEQAGGPPLNPIEMAMPDSAAVEARLRRSPAYRAAFAAAFPGEAEPITFTNMARAVAAFERTLRTPARLDDYLAGESSALTPDERAGMATFVRVGCAACHQGALLGGDRLSKIGLIHPYTLSPDTGAGDHTFRVAQLRNVTLTPPYFHDGLVSTVAEATDRMGWVQLARRLEPAEILAIARFLTTTADRTRTVDMAWPETGWWSPRAPGEVPAGAAARGRELLSDTRRLLHLESGTAAHASGNALNCTSCHQELGTKRFGIPWVGVAARYPSYRARSGHEGDLRDRINGCLERSMNGQALPKDSPELAAMVAYMNWLSEDVPERLEGAGVPEFRYPDRRVDLDAGHQVYMGKCESCHAADGQGYRTESGAVIMPPLWGEDSYNDGAGMHRVLTAAAFVRANMPLGTPHNRPALTAAEAFDVAGYINSKPRPRLAGTETDYPNLVEKPVDSPYPPFVDDFPAEQHKYGPFGPLEAQQKALKAAGRRVANPHVRTN